MYNVWYMYNLIKSLLSYSCPFSSAVDQASSPYTYCSASAISDVLRFTFVDWLNCSNSGIADWLDNNCTIAHCTPEGWGCADEKWKSMYMTYIFKAILAQLCKYMQKAENGEPGAPQHYLFHLLGIHNSENEDELVENKVPEFVLHVLQKRRQIITNWVNKRFT